MITRNILKNTFHINPPAEQEIINKGQEKINIPLPKNYIDLLKICNGLYSNGNLALHEIEILPERNLDYEVESYLPGYFMIGDDSGGQAIVINSKGEIYEVGMGTMDKTDLKKSADSIEDLLIKYQGKTLNER